MAISMSASSMLPLIMLALLCYATPAAAFGAGNIASISKIEGSNWRHGDIEDTLLQLFMATAATGGRKKKFDAMTIKRIYFGNWLRDYSQAIDVGALKKVEAGTIRILLWILSFMTFGLATGEFEVTEERLGCYRPEEHIDNPKDYADNEDATVYWQGLRKQVDEDVELGIDPETGMKNYIANENLAINTGERMDSSGMFRMYKKSWSALMIKSMLSWPCTQALHQIHPARPSLCTERQRQGPPRSSPPPRNWPSLSRGFLRPLQLHRTRAYRTRRDRRLPSCRRQHPGQRRRA
jgi:hypothetical protein